MKALFASIAALTLVASASAQSLVAGWDFSQYIGSGFNSTDGATFTQTLSANYSSLDPTFGAGAESAAFGTFYYNGAFGSTNATVGFSQNDVQPVSPSLASNINAPVPNPFDSFSILAFEGQTSTNSLAFTANSGTSLVFRANLTSINSVASAWSLSLGGLNSVGSSTINAEFSTNGVDYISAGSIGLTTADTRFALTLPSATSDQAFVRLNFAGANGFIDNVAISAGSITAVPEPATYGAIAGAILLGFAAYRRRRRA